MGLMSLDQIEAWAIGKTLKHTKYNVSKAEKILGVTRATIYRKAKKYDIKIKRN